MKTFINFLLALIIAVISIMVGGVTGIVLATVAMGFGFNAISKTGNLLGNMTA
jgi:hypothetical protein